MIFSKNDVVIEYTVEHCDSCQNTSKRKFKKDDYLFKETSSCHSCNGHMKIEKIFGETIKE